MSDTHRYSATVSREDGYWVAVVAGILGGAAETRRLIALHTEVLDLLAGLLDVDDLEITYALSPALGGAGAQLTRYRDAQLQLAQARDDHETSQAVVVHDLRSAEVSLRDAAELLGVSSQRVQQLSAGPRNVTGRLSE